MCSVILACVSISLREIHIKRGTEAGRILTVAIELPRYRGKCHVQGLREALQIITCQCSLNHDLKMYTLQATLVQMIIPPLQHTNCWEQ